MTTDAIYEERGSVGYVKFLSWRQLDGCSVTRPFLSLRRVWLARLEKGLVTIECFLGCAKSAILKFDRVNDYNVAQFHWLVAMFV